MFSSTCPPAVSGTTTDYGCTNFILSGDRDRDTNFCLPYIGRSHGNGSHINVRYVGSTIISRLRVPEAMII